MPDKRSLLVIYWTVQVLAWTGYMFLLGLPSWLESGFTWPLAQVTLAMSAIGIVGSHVLRTRFREWRWLELAPAALLPRMALGAIVVGALAGLLQAALHDMAFPTAEPLIGPPLRRMVEVLLSWVLQLLLWQVVYVAYHYVARGRKEQLRALQLEAANREGQLANLRSQLNPHFMFNALNSIRALIGEDPERAKRSITQLSAILRNAMSTVKRRTVPLGEEIDMVRAYLSLEAIRYEERLNVVYELDPALERSPVPPMMLQTLVENAVRHGIAASTSGGTITISATKVPDGISLCVRNTGHYGGRPERASGIGLRNTRKRLMHMYGTHAGLRIRNEGGEVVCEVHLPDTGNTAVEIMKSLNP